ncbi:Sensor histidine kinase RcsC [uncultured Comamonas sp.]|nr:Sensor histidine kinase RcsC [uncultured Comamonas sp.]
MDFFRNLSLTGKIVFLVSLLGTLAFTITVYSLAHLYTVDRDYRALLDREARAAVLVTEATNDLNDASRLVFAVLTEQEAAAMRAALAVLDAQQASFQAKMAQARPLLPAAAAQLDTIQAQEEQLFTLAEATVSAAARWRGDRALEIIHGQFEPLLAGLRANMEQVRSDTVQRFQSASQALGATTQRTLRNTALAFGAALTAVIGLAVWLSLTRITRPLKALTGAMERLAQRDYAQTIAHTDRRDEVGQMAQALEIFRAALQRSDYLEAAKAEAEQLALAKSRFLATMSHEIRTPLHAIIGLAQSSLRRPLPHDQQGRVEKIQRAGEHLLGVINNILDFSKIEGGYLQVEAVPFAPPQLLDDVRVLLAGKAAAKSLILLTETHVQPPVLLGDPLRLRQILFNFASNAIKFSERGTVHLRLGLEQAGGQCWLLGEVSDQGIGLSPAQIEGLFQPFQQADASISRRYGGTGLGLAISHSLAQLLGGTLGVRSQSGVGSTFWVRVPVQEAQAGAVPVPTRAASTPSPDALQGLRVLLVDDNELNRLVGSELLADAGVQCAEACDGQQAVQMLEQAADGTYDVVLMDMMMPGMDGITATRLLRQNPRFAGLPIIAMTANTSEQDIATCLAAGMQALVPKPVDEQILWNTLLVHCAPALAARPPWRPEAPSRPVPPPAAPDGIDVGAALERLDNDTGLFVRLLRIFLHENQAGTTAVRQALAQGALKTARLHLHTLQGQAATLGAMALQQAAAQVQALVPQQTADARPRDLPMQALAPALAQLDVRLQYDCRQLQALLAQWPQAGDPPSPALPAGAQLPRVLLVDDQPDSALVVQRILQPDYAVAIVHSGQQALDFCRTQPLPELILLDVVMPGMDGLQVCRRLKADPRTQAIPVLFVTAQSAPEEESAALAAGGVDFITKPVNHAVVRARVQTHLLLKRHSDQLRASALHDGLTGIANRRHFDAALAQAWRDGRRQRQSLALCMVDIDHFKQYNDRYGHPAGDACLRQVTQALQQHMGRAHDLLARFGGEEFVCLLPGMDWQAAQAKARALCDSVAALRLEHAASPVAPWVTISVGVAVWTFDQDGAPQALLAAADAALYAAKQAGRNRAVLTGEQENQ